MKLEFIITDPQKRAGSWRVSFDTQNVVKWIPAPPPIGQVLNPARLQYESGYMFLIRAGSARGSSASMASSIKVGDFSFANYDGCGQPKVFGEQMTKSYLEQWDSSGVFGEIQIKTRPIDSFYPPGIIMPGEYVCYCQNGGYYWKSNSVYIEPTAQVKIKKNPDGTGQWWIEDLQMVAANYFGFYLSTHAGLNEIPATQMDNYGPHIGTGEPLGRDKELSTAIFSITTAGTLQDGVNYYAYAYPNQCGNTKIYTANQEKPITPETEIIPPTQDGKVTLTVERYPVNSELSVATASPLWGVIEYSIGEQADISVSGVPAGWRFVRWEVDVDPATASNQTISVTMSNNKRVRAIFERKRYAVTISVGSGSGTTTPETGTTYFVQHGDSLVIEAIPANGYTFEDWDGDFLNSNRIATIQNITGNLNVNANFTRVTGSITFKRGGLAGCGGTIDVTNLVANQKTTLSADELWLGKVMTFPIGTDLLIEAKGLETTQFDKFIEGAPLQKRLGVSGSYTIVDTLDTDPNQYLASVNGNRTIQALFFCKPDDKPIPRWTYTIKCPVPTLSDGTGNPSTPITPENSVPIANLSGVVINDSTVKLTWTPPVGATLVVVQKKLLTDSDASYQTVNSGLTDGQMLSIGELTVAGLTVGLDYKFRVIAFNGLNNGISNEVLLTPHL